jgi:hypothetical protein
MTDLSGMSGKSAGLENPVDSGESSTHTYRDSFNKVEETRRRIMYGRPNA